MEIFFDIRTLSLVSGLVSFSLAFILAYASKRSKTYNGFNNWVLALLLNSFGVIAISLQELYHPVFTISIANFAIILYLILIHLGFRQFFNLNSGKWIPVYMLTVVVHTIWNIYFTYIIPSAPLRMSIALLIYAFYTIDSMRLIIRYSKRVIPQTQWLFITMLGIASLWLFTVVITIMFSHQQVQEFFDSGLISALTLLINMVANILGAFGMILINNQRLYMDFTQSNKQVQQLRELLPICANCKKIRDDSGYWDHLEGYLSEHTSLNLSHSICPDCMQKLYPGLNINSEEEEMKQET